MIQLFANTLLQYIDINCTHNLDVKISPDSDNAIVLEHNGKTHYWLITVNMVTNMFDMQTVILDCDYNRVREINSSFLTLKIALDQIIDIIDSAKQS